MKTITENPPAVQVLDPRRASLYAERVYRVALRLTRSVHDAEDLTQETFAKVLARPRVIREGDELGYLIAALRNVHRSAIRTAGRRPTTVHFSEDVDFLAGHRADPHVATVARETVAAIAELPTDQRAVVVAVDLLGLSYAEAAADLCIPNGTVMSRLHRARAALAKPEGQRPVGLPA